MASAIDHDESPTDRLGKLLPSEVTGLYVSLRAFFVDPNIKDYGYYLVGIATIATIVALCYIIFVRKVRNTIHIAIYMATFVVWALSLDVDHIKETFKIEPHVPLQQIAGCLSILISFAFPFLISSSSVASTGPRLSDE